MSTRAVLRDLLTHARRVEGAAYDGDVVLLPQDRWAFGVVWRNGILHIVDATKSVGWTDPVRFSGRPYYFHTNGSCVDS